MGSMVRGPSWDRTVSAYDARDVLATLNEADIADFAAREGTFAGLRETNAPVF